MKNKKIIFIILACFLYNFTLWSDAIITLFIKQYPIMPNSNYCQDLSHSLKHPGTIAEHCLYGLMDSTLQAGIFATYAGYLNVSNVQGQLSFPYKHSKKAVNMLITPHITPILMAGNTVHHWELEDANLAALFTIEQKNDDVAKLTYWDIEQIALPTDKKIPTQTIIIIANPHEIYVPIGASPVIESASLLLPDIYVKKGINHVADSLYVLNLKHLFSPVHYQYKADPSRNTILITP